MPGVAGERSAAASTLYDQYNSYADDGFASQDFEAGLEAYDTQGGDDFVVPGGQRWTITSVDVAGQYSPGGGPATSVNVFFHANGAGNLPTTLVTSRVGSGYLDGANPGDFVVALTPHVVLTPGTYWISVQSRQDSDPAGQWYWNIRSLIANNEAVWQNPGDGFGSGCVTWARASNCLPYTGNDFMFRLSGYVRASSILYDQYDNALVNAVTSQDFETGFDSNDSQAADDFVVPVGQKWTISSVDVDGRYFNGIGPATSVNVKFFANGAGNLPGTLLASRTGNGYRDTADSGDLAVTLTSGVVLNPGTYWVSVQARQDYNPDGQWGWTYRSLVSNSGATWRNPADGFGTGCTNWTRVVCAGGVNGDLVFRLIGSAAPLPTVTSVTPNVGPTGGGQTVTILGTRFTGASAVTFGGVAASSFSVVSPGRINAVTPAHAAGVVNVRVTTPLGTSAVVPADQYTYQGPPTISSVTPNAGPTGGGRTVTILGSRFIGTNWLTFGTVAATSFTVVSATRITAVTPAHAAGLTNVRVHTPSGTSAIVAADQYTFQGPPTISSVTPNSGPTAGGQTVIILGTNFTATNQVYFGGVAATSFTVVSATRISAVTPAHAAGLFHVRVNTPVGISAAVSADRYTFN